MREIINCIMFCMARGGSNHILANLYYQEKIFCFSERVKFPNIEIKDTLGYFANNCKQKYEASDIRIWKLNSGYCFLNQNLIFKSIEKICPSVCGYLRHPALVHKSVVEFGLKRDRPEWAQKTINDIVQDYVIFFEMLYAISQIASKEVFITFHENTIKDLDSQIRYIVEKFDPSRKKQKILNYLDFFKGDKDIKTGYGYYRTDRKIDFEEEKKIILQSKYIIEEIYNKSVKSVFLDSFYKYYYDIGNIEKARNNLFVKENK